jgi:hypothetical protein
MRWAIEAFEIARYGQRIGVDFAARTSPAARFHHRTVFANGSGTSTAMPSTSWASASSARSSKFTGG